MASKRLVEALAIALILMMVAGALPVGAEASSTPSLPSVGAPELGEEIAEKGVKGDGIGATYTKLGDGTRVYDTIAGQYTFESGFADAQMPGGP